MMTVTRKFSTTKIFLMSRKLMEFEEKQKALEAIVSPILSSLGGGAAPGEFPGGPGGFPGGAPGGSGPSEAADEGPKIEEIN